MSNHTGRLANLFAGAAAAGTISQATQTLLTGNLGTVVVAGAAGTAMDDISASDVTLVTVLIDASSSIGSSGLEQAVRDGQNQLVEAFNGSSTRDSVMLAQWSFNHDQTVYHSYVPVADAVRLDRRNYQSGGTTRLYDTWCDALAANVAYAQRLRDAGTPCRSVVVVITDGADYGSKRTARECAKVSKDLLASEQFVLAFVGVGSDTDFRAVAKSMGVPDASVAVATQATPSELRRVFQMVSQSAIRASQGQIQPGPNAGFFVP
jgi:uncharacterized protein YegL